MTDRCCYTFDVPYKDHSNQLAARARYRERHRERLRVEALNYSRSEVGRNRLKEYRDSARNTPEAIRHRVEYSLKMAEWHATRAERKIERQRRYREGRKRRGVPIVVSEKSKARRKAIYIDNREKVLVRVKASNKRWRANNPDKYRELRRRGKAKRRGAYGVLSSGIFSRLFLLQRGLCPVCKCVLVEYHLDHVMPIALGGTNTDDNVQLLCPPCNIRKGAKHPEEFAASIGLLL